MRGYSAASERTQSVKIRFAPIGALALALARSANTELFISADRDAQ